MTKQSFIPSVKEDLNRLHNVTLTEGQISTILYILEGYVDGLNPDPHLLNDNDNEELIEEIDNIFQELEGVVDNFYS